MIDANVPKQRVAAKAVIEVGGKFLVLHPSAIDANRKWHIPGGIRDDISEPLHTTAVREVMEETGIDLGGLEGKLLRIGEWPAIDKGEQVKILAVFFHFILPTQPNIVLSNEHDAFAWIDAVNHLDYEANVEVHEIVDALGSST
jgi:8-oxo-dGTP pyrophosphatase MutT (NUDIX family)